MSYNKNSWYWQAIMMQIASQVWPLFGKILVVVPSSTDPNYDRLKQLFDVDTDWKVRFYTTLSAAYDAATTNANDVILLSWNATHSLTAWIAWTKNRVNVIGMDGGDRLVQQWAKVQLATAATTAYVIKVTWVRNSFRNIKFIQAATAATWLNVLQEGGEGNLYKNCSFVFGVADNLDLTTASEVITGSDSATYLNCTFGSDTLLTSAARTVFLIDQVTESQEFKSNIIKDCIFMISSSSATAYLLSVAANTDVLFTNLFIKCQFMASIDSAGGAALTNAITSASSLVKWTLNFYLPWSFNCTNFSASDSTNVKVYAPATSTNAFEAWIPA